MWDMLLSFLPIMLVILGILIVAIVTLKLFERYIKPRSFRLTMKKSIFCFRASAIRFLKGVISVG